MTKKLKTKAKTKAKTKTKTAPVVAYKGFNPDMTCRGFQYAEGGEYSTDSAVLCEYGFHACENPLGCFSHYRPTNSVYHKVEVSGDIDKRGGDTKMAATCIKIGPRLDLNELIGASADYVLQKVKRSGGSVSPEHYAVLSGGKGANLAGGDGANIAGGDGANIACWHDANIAGGRGANLAGGYSASIAGGDDANIAGGNDANIAGGRGANIAGGEGANIAGGDGANIAGGDGANIAGGRGANIAGGDGANIVGGIRSNLVGGRRASLVCNGAASVGKHGVAVVRGGDVRVRGGMGAVLVIAIDDFFTDSVHTATIVIDGKNYMPDTWYTLSASGKVVKC